MEEVLEVLSSLVSDRVRHFELVKITNKSFQGKAYVLVADKGLHLVTCNLSGLLKGGSFRYESIRRIEQEGNKITLNLVSGTSPLVESLGMETPCNTKLYTKIRVALGADYMLGNFKEAESCTDEDSDDDVQIAGQERTLLPFKGYKKVTLNDHFLFVRDSFEHTSFASGNLTRLQDNARGMSINVNLREPVRIHSPEQAPPQDLYQYSRGFLHEFQVMEVLKDEFYNKRMNLNSDLAMWSCYHLLIKTDTSLVAFFVFRRLYMPPMLDNCQDILIRFDVSTTRHLGSGIKDSRYKDLIQVRLDNLRFDYAMYEFLKFQCGMVPSYYNLIKGFVSSVLRLLPQDLVDPTLVAQLKDPDGVISDEPMDYIYTIKTLIFGIGTVDESTERQELINKFNMRLADFIAICIDELLLDNQLSLTILTKYLNSMEEDKYKKTLREVTAYLMHFRSNDFSKEYSSALMDEILETYSGEQCCFSWTNVIFNHYATSRMIEEGFFIHQYARSLQKVEGGWNPYVNLLTDLIEQYRKDIIIERICKKFLEIPRPIDVSYLPLVKCLIGMLRRHTTNYKIVLIVTSILTNFSFHSMVFKDHMIKYGVATILVGNMLHNEHQIVLATLKLMINITKTTEQQDAFLNQGVMSSFITVLGRYYEKNSDIIGYSAGVLGQLFNSTNVSIAPNQIEYITEIMLYAFHIGTSDPTMMVMIMFCLRKLPKTSNIYIKIGKHVIRSIIMNLQIYNDDDFVINSLELLLGLTMRVYNCISMRKFGLVETLDQIRMNDTVVQIANKVKERIMRKTRHLSIPM
ncbi:hypothetical protein X943_002915 [Babesia divergens]|uniref:Uncharacterized protein n=1 Tax=Babesia divergens TaxID=32595 RepID=A0AAD9GEB2_BABDI|nr:hypothetical protein X943_002915 [Babesia divergens]